MTYWLTAIVSVAGIVLCAYGTMEGLFMMAGVQ
ncbi:hypothetical protein C7446_1380 [Kushneria sinocarnis]|uniref:Uncharacterized protein n=1 Tax=Kushneria sinocarnis TaxID=595502 RepID=A0A420WWS2_9GAMM|nr:hypothetical protein C7446_1380 [Kushneria sinocarnis]